MHLSKSPSSMSKTVCPFNENVEIIRHPNVKKTTQQTSLDLGNHAPQKHEEMGGFLTENGMKMLAEGVVHLGKNAIQR